MLDLNRLPADWRKPLAPAIETPSWGELNSFLRSERSNYQVFPPEDSVYSALENTPLTKVKAVIIGQDPYHDTGQAHGLCFSVPDNVPKPPSLKNVLKELQTDLGVPAPASGNLMKWASEGVLLLNSVLTVRAHLPASHAGRGWEDFTDSILSEVSRQSRPIAFILWGNHAVRKTALVDQTKHMIIRSAHPSPLSAHRGFFGSRPFTKVNEFLSQNGIEKIDWRLADEQ